MNGSTVTDTYQQSTPDVPTWKNPRTSSTIHVKFASVITVIADTSHTTLLQILTDGAISHATDVFSRLSEAIGIRTRDMLIIVFLAAKMFLLWE